MQQCSYLFLNLRWQAPTRDKSRTSIRYVNKRRLNYWYSNLAALLLILESSSDIEEQLIMVHNRISPARSRYYNFGLNMGLDIQTMEQIKCAVNDQSGEGLYQVLYTWKRQNSHLSWKKIADALTAPSVGVIVTISPNWTESLILMCIASYSKVLVTTIYSYI